MGAALTPEELVLQDALEAAGYRHVTVWKLKCVEAFLEGERSGPRYNTESRLLRDLRLGLHGTHRNALALLSRGPR